MARGKSTVTGRAAQPFPGKTRRVDAKQRAIARAVPPAGASVSPGLHGTTRLPPPCVENGSIAPRGSWARMV